MEFDLAERAASARRAARSSNLPFIAIWSWGVGVAAAAVGVLALLGRISGGVPLGVGAIVVGLGVLLVGLVAYSRLGSHGVVRYRVDNDGVHFDRRGGTTRTLAWSDPHLKFDLNVFSRGADAVLPAADARKTSPFWIDVWRFPSRWVELETTLPREAIDATIEEARRHAVLVATAPVGYYWQFSMKGSGGLAYVDADHLGPGQTINGEITRVRGAALDSDVD